MIQLEETATAAVIKVKRKDHGYSAGDKFDRWRFNLAQTVCRNWQAKIFSKVLKIPRKTSKLGIEIQSYDSRYEYNTFLAKYSNKVLLRCRNHGTYIVEGKMPNYSKIVGYKEFLEVLQKWFDDEFRFEIKYVSANAHMSHYSNAILIERVVQRPEAFVLNI